MLGACEAYGDDNTIATLTREVVQQAAYAVAGSDVARHHDGVEFDPGGAWATVTLRLSVGCPGAKR
jgi:lysyl-tRNA synthetase class 2